MSIIGGSAHNVLVMILMPALLFASMTIHSHARLLSDSLAARGGRAELKWSVLEMSSRDEMVRMAGYGEEKLSTVLITGTLLCSKACLLNKARPRQLIPPHPISGALVAVTCHSNNTGKGEMTGAEAVSDKYGEFVIDLPSQLHAIHNLDKACSVKVVQLPKKSPCRESASSSTPKGISLSSIEAGIRIYAAGTMTFHGIPKNSKACMKAKGQEISR